MKGNVTLSQRQLKRLKVMYAYIDKRIDRKRAAELLSLSERQVTRLKKGLINEGETFLIHKNIGRKPTRAIPGDHGRPFGGFRRRQHHAAEIHLV